MSSCGPWVRLAAMTGFSASDRILDRNRQYIPGGISSINRLTDPNIAFVRGEGSHLWDAEGREYIDYHGAFAPQFLGYRHPDVHAAVQRVLEDGQDLWGSGPTELEGRLAYLICEKIPWIERVTVLNSGSEATAQAIRLARAVTAKPTAVESVYVGSMPRYSASVSVPKPAESRPSTSLIFSPASSSALYAASA